MTGPAAASPLVGVADLVWCRLPAAVRRGSLTLSVALSDGDYLRAWPRVAVAVPAVALVLGLTLGALHPGPTFSASAVVLALLVLVAGVGAGPGVWSWLGFVVGDLLFADRSSLPAWSGAGDDGLLSQDLVLRAYLPLALTYLVLWALLVVGPLLATSTRWGVRGALRRAPAVQDAAGLAVQLAVQVGYVYLWAHAAAFLIRPLWSYAGATPDITAIEPLQSAAGWLAALTLVTVGARVGLAEVARSRLPAPKRPAAAPKPWPLPIRVVGQTALLTFLLSGLVDGLVEGVVLVVVLAAVVILRLLVVPRLGGYPTAVRKVPAVLRMAVSAAIGYLLTQLFVLPLAQAGEQSFVSMLAVVVISLSVGALLLPGAPPLPPAAPARPGHPAAPRGGGT